MAHGKKHDVIIIGTGPGGFSAAVHLARFGKKVCMVEKDPLGGTCLHIGCIPTKSWVAGSKNLFNLGKLDSYGITLSSYNFDYSVLKARVDSIVQNRMLAEEKLFENLEIDFVQGTACLSGPRTVIVEDDNENMVLEGNYIIISSGSRPMPLPKVDFGGNIISSTEALSLQNPPKSLMVIGGGVIGCEFAQVFNRLGSKVTIIEALPSLLPQIDVDISTALKRKFEEGGISVNTSERVKNVQNSSERVTVTTESGKQFSAEKMLVAIGRKTNIEELGLDNLNIPVQSGRIKVDAHRRTFLPSVFAIGDIVEGPQLANKAVYEGFIAAENILGNPMKTKELEYVNQCVFTDPAVASVGLSEKEASKQGEIWVANISLAKNAYAEAYSEGEGFIKMICEKKSGRLLGIHIIGPGATDLIVQGALALKQKLTIRDWIGLALLIPHPSLSEGIRDAVRELYCRCFGPDK